MKDFLQRIGLIDHMVVELECDRYDFAERLGQMIEPGSMSEFFNFEAFSSDKREYKGTWNENGFSIRRKARLFENRYRAVATGRFMGTGERFTVQYEIIGWKNAMYFYYGFLIFFYVLFIGVFFLAANTADDIPLPMLPFILVHALLMFGLPFLFARRAVKRLKHDLERELHFVASKANKARPHGPRP